MEDGLPGCPSPLSKTVWYCRVQPLLHGQFRLEHNVMPTAYAGDIPDHGLIPGLFLSFSSALDSDISVLLDCVFTLVWDPGLRNPGLKGFCLTVLQCEMELSIDLGNGRDRGLNLPSALKFRCGS